MRLRFLLATVVAVLTASLAAQQVYEDGADGVSSPTATKKVPASYSDQARAAGVEGHVVMRAVVTAPGTIRDVVVAQSLEPSLDAAAVAALQQWEFKPGRKDGQPVAVRMTFTTRFTLR